jgi:hypothetical protein
MREAEKVTVEASEATYPHTARLLRAELQPVLVAAQQMVMPHVRRIADDDIEAW